MASATAAHRLVVAGENGKNYLLETPMELSVGEMSPYMTDEGSFHGWPLESNTGICEPIIHVGVSSCSVLSRYLAASRDVDLIARWFVREL